MKKYSTILIVLGVLMFSHATFAATTASMSPSSVNAVAGTTFTITVSVDSATDVNDAEKIEIKYPTDLVSVTNVAQTNEWMALTQAGYDSLDATNGILIKTAGLPGGFSGKKVFETITFTAKSAGVGQISIDSNSIAFQESTQTAITSAPVAITITAPLEQKVTTVTTTPVKKVAPVEAVKAPEVVAPAQTETVTTQALSASAIGAGTWSVRSGWFWAFIVTLIALLAVSARFYVYAKKYGKE
ncbi:MAG: cohesin domain-containing protein [bacterium]